ncbi:NAD(P)/FAD-dependent oxidoreductase [Streptomyces sp. NBC_00083]|uniref:phytoene desaturase family protein n=1 Tax=Streptomyces sp. NBC_00083 TaxID=2975647 RepID=UPI002252D450|nr:FAD-dependent oxidoreductase [Streptomyces sp. NBC_00083]MCX5387848.1 FAD-dependent oxidoreductase [Streptomyces sp. NBC_00083]
MTSGTARGTTAGPAPAPHGPGGAGRSRAGLISVVGGGFAGLTAAITAAESGAAVTLYEAHSTLGGRARTASAPYRTNEGPHALYSAGPHWSWLKQRGLLGPVASVRPREALRFRFHRGGALHRLPPPALLRLARTPPELAPVDADFMTWATGRVGAKGARAAAHYVAVALFHHDPGSLSARFVQERLHRVAGLPPEARYPLGGWGALIERMASRARELGVRVETGARVSELPRPSDGPIVVATSLDAARRLLGDPRLRWPSGRTLLLDLALTPHRADPFVVSDLDAPGWLERFTVHDPGLAPAGEHLYQAHFPLAQHATKADGVTHATRLLDAALPAWRARTSWRREALAAGRTGAVDPPTTTWRDRPAIARAPGLYLAGDQVAAPGILSEVSFTSGIEAATLALKDLGRARLHAQRG